MPAAPHPRMHGLTHVRGGPDPIPGIPAGPTVTGSYVEQVLAHPDLVHYWRMGAASGNQPDTAPLYTPVDLQPQVTGDPGTYNVTGALISADDDGAYQTGDGGTGAGHATDGFYTGSAVTHRGYFGGNDPLTVELWAKVVYAFGTHQAMVSCGSSGNQNWVLEIAFGTGELRFRRGGTGGLSTVGVADWTVWHHYTVTYDGTVTRIYLDGALFFNETNTAVIPGYAQPVRVGRESAPTDSYFGGVIDEVALYVACLTDAEIAAHYDAGVNGATSPDGLVWTSDGDGNTSWQLPTFATYANGA